MTNDSRLILYVLKNFCEVKYTYVCTICLLANCSGEFLSILHIFIYVYLILSPLVILENKYVHLLSDNNQNGSRRWLHVCYYIVIMCNAIKMKLLCNILIT